MQIPNFKLSSHATRDIFIQRKFLINVQLISSTSSHSHVINSETRRVTALLCQNSDGAALPIRVYDITSPTLDMATADSLKSHSQLSHGYDPEFF